MPLLREPESCSLILAIFLVVTSSSTRQAVKSKLGERLEVFMQPSGTEGMRCRPRVLKAEPNYEPRWLGRSYLLRSIACGNSFLTQTSILALVVLPWLMFALKFLLGFHSVFSILASVRSWQLTGGCAQQHHC